LAGPERELDQPVLGTVKGNHNYASAPGADAEYSLQKPLQVFKFPIHRDPQGLEGARRGVNAAAPPPARPRHNRGQIAGSGNRVLGAGLTDCPGDAPAVAFVTVAIYKVGQILLAHVIDIICGSAFLAEVEPHIERTIRGERETAIGIGELVRGKAQISQNPIEPVEPGFARNRRCIGKVGVCQYRALPEPGELLPGALDRVGIGVDGEQPPVGSVAVQDQAGMPPAAGGGVEVVQVRLRIEQGKCFARHHRLV